MEIVILVLSIIVCFLSFYLYTKTQNAKEWEENYSNLYNDSVSIYMENDKLKDQNVELVDELNKLKEDYKNLKDTVVYKEAMKEISEKLGKEYSLISKIGELVYYRNSKPTDSHRMLEEVVIKKDGIYFGLENYSYDISADKIFGENKIYTLDKEEWADWKRKEFEKYIEKA